MFVNALFGAVSAASWDYATFLLLRFVSGLGSEIHIDFVKLQLNSQLHVHSKSILLMSEMSGR